MTTSERTVEVAADVARVLEQRGFQSAVIGAVALAVRGYPRATTDLDLATLVHPQTLVELRNLAKALLARGYEVELLEADAEDPLGGVINVHAEGADLVQVVNYFNPWNGSAVAGRRALETAEPNALGSLAVVDVPHLIALKLYAGVSAKTVADVNELLARRPEFAEEVRAVCRALGLEAELDAVLGRR